jgi:hypothetical protein
VGNPSNDLREAELRRILLATTVAVAAFLALATTATAVPNWAPAGSATVHPGVMTFTEGSGQCTSNFIFYDGSNNVYIGQAAHCAGTGAATETDGCDAGTLPLGTRVEVDGATQPGTIVYSSWIAMQQANEQDANTCAYNDFALVKLDPADYGKVNPSIPFWGGPTGVTATVANLSDVLSYGNSSLRLGVEALSPKQGKQLSQGSGGWNHHVYTVTPGIPGDSGSAFIDDQGRAFGTLSTVQAAPAPASNGVGDVSREIDYMLSHGGPAVTLAHGTEPFSGSLP